VTVRRFTAGLGTQELPEAGREPSTEKPSAGAPERAQHD
jgi:hypothetical protein